MRLLTLLGGLFGFVSGLVFGWLNESPLPVLLLRAGIAAYVAGLLLRWWGRVWLRGLREARAGGSATAAAPGAAGAQGRS